MDSFFECSMLLGEMLADNNDIQNVDYPIFVNICLYPSGRARFIQILVYCIQILIVNNIILIYIEIIIWLNCFDVNGDALVI